MQVPPETQVVIDFDDNRAASALVGPYGQNLAQIERRLDALRQAEMDATPSAPSTTPPTAPRTATRSSAAKGGTSARARRATQRKGS